MTIACMSLEVKDRQVSNDVSRYPTSSIYQTCSITSSLQAGSRAFSLPAHSSYLSAEDAPKVTWVFDAQAAVGLRITGTYSKCSGTWHGHERHICDASHQRRRFSSIDLSCRDLWVCGRFEPTMLYVCSSHWYFTKSPF